MQVGLSLHSPESEALRAVSEGATTPSLQVVSTAAFLPRFPVARGRAAGAQGRFRPCAWSSIGIRGFTRVSRIQQSYVATLLTTLGGADDAGAHVRIRLVEAADIARIVVVIENL